MYKNEGKEMKPQRKIRKLTEYLDPQDIIVNNLVLYFQGFFPCIFDSLPSGTAAAVCVCFFFP